MKMFDVYPLYDINIVRAEGSYVWDDKGTKYLDMYGGHAVISIGHTHPHYVEMVTNQLKNIGFYSNSVIIAQQKELAEKLGRLLAKQHIRLINGAGSIGLMRSVADAVLKNGGEVTGVIPHFMVEQNWHHTGLTELIEVTSMHERKQKMANLSDGIIALPGGCGTLEELLEIITWKQLGLYLNPIIILNINGFFDPLFQMLERAIEENFMRQQHGDIWKVAQTPEEAVELLQTTPVWDASIRKFAAI